jgi:pilus assembly protein CpaC
LENGLQAQTPPSAGVSRQDSANDLSVAVGKTVLVDCAKPVSRVSIGLGDIAEVQAVSPTEILVNGKTAGETNLIIWDRSGGRQFFNVSVRASDAVANDNLDAVRREIRTELPGQTIKVTYDNGNVFLRGTVKTLNNSNRAAQIAAVAGKVVNLLYIDVPASESQILLKVRFASVDRSKEKQLGINLFSTGYGNVIGGVTTGQYSPPSVTPGTGGAASSLSLSNELNLFAFLPGLDLGATLQAMETRGLVELLAEPNLLSESGKEATFLAGGEFPYPVAQASAGGGSTISIQFKEYGVRLSFIPTVTPRGTIHLQVAPEVSALDFSNALTLSGFTVPAINVRNVNTEVELGDGQSFAIGGLMDNTESDTFVKIPFLGDIPILGKFFQSMTRSKGNTELIVIVTPQIVAPIEAGAAVPVLKYPEKFLPPNSGIPMTTPENKVAGATPPPPTLPVEKLIDSMKPEKPLIIQGVSGAFGSGATLGGGATASPTPPQ